MTGSAGRIQGLSLRTLRLPARAPVPGDCEGAGLEFLVTEGRLKDPRNCACSSADFFILAGAVYRSGEEIFVHRPFVDREYLTRMSGAEASAMAGKIKADAIQYLKDMGLPDAIIEYVWSTPGNRTERLPGDMRLRYFFGFIPEFQDWHHAKCSADRTERCLTQVSKELQAEAYAEFFEANRGPAHAGRGNARLATPTRRH